MNLALQNAAREASSRGQIESLLPLLHDTEIGKIELVADDAVGNRLTIYFEEYDSFGDRTTVIRFTLGRLTSVQLDGFEEQNVVHSVKVSMSADSPGRLKLDVIPSVGSRVVAVCADLQVELIESIPDHA